MSPWRASAWIGLALTLAAGGLRAQTVPPPAANAAQGVAPLPHGRRVLLAGVLGAAAGVVLGTEGLSYNGIPASEVGVHRARAGITYGLIGGVLAAAATEALTPDPVAEPHRFWVDRWNTPLFVGIAAVQVLDYTSTRDFRNHGRDEWLLTNSLVDDRPAFAATEVAAAGAAIGLSYLLYRSGHHRLERWTAGLYVAIGAASAYGNYHYATTGHDIFGQGGIF